MPTRGLTSGELQILDFVFYDTIDLSGTKSRRTIECRWQRQ